MLSETSNPLELSLDDFIIMIKGMKTTCSADELENYSVTFVKSEEWLTRLVDNLRGTRKEIATMCSNHLQPVVQKLEKNLVAQMRPFYFEDVERKFTQVHNYLNANRPPKLNLISTSAMCHPSALIGANAMRVIYDPSCMDKPLKMLHMGNVVIGEGVDIGPHATIHRASLGSTIIGDHSHIGSYVNIGHNVHTGKYCCFTPYVCVGGSTRMGDNILVGMQTVIRDNIRICGDVKIGMGSLVVKTIDEPGVYYGRPAVKKGEWDGRW